MCVLFGHFPRHTIENSRFFYSQCSAMFIFLTIASKPPSTMIPVRTTTITMRTKIAPPSNTILLHPILIQCLFFAHICLTIVSMSTFDCVPVCFILNQMRPYPYVYTFFIICRIFIFFTDIYIFSFVFQTYQEVNEIIKRKKTVFYLYFCVNGIGKYVLNLFFLILFVCLDFFIYLLFVVYFYRWMMMMHASGLGKDVLRCVRHHIINALPSPTRLASSSDGIGKWSTLNSTNRKHTIEYRKRKLKSKFQLFILNGI